MDLFMWMGANKVFEVAMLLAFGAAWPFSIRNSWQSKSTKGKSPTFLMILIVGYICGIINKLTTGVDYVIWFYLLNLVMVSIDLSLYFRNRKLERA